MLLTKDWQLKLTDFGEARAVNLNQVRSTSKHRKDDGPTRPQRDFHALPLPLAHVCVWPFVHT